MRGVEAHIHSSLSMFVSCGYVAGERLEQDFGQLAAAGKIGALDGIAGPAAAD
jgi:hypothetical protein